MFIANPRLSTGLPIDFFPRQFGALERTAKKRRVEDAEMAAMQVRPCAAPLRAQRLSAVPSPDCILPRPARCLKRVLIMNYVEQAVQFCLMQHVQYQLLCGGRPVFTSQVHVSHVSSQPSYELACGPNTVFSGFKVNVMFVLTWHKLFDKWITLLGRVRWPQMPSRLSSG